jgi:hypothetical protein
MTEDDPMSQKKEEKKKIPSPVLTREDIEKMEALAEVLSSKLSSSKDF